jgi:UDP-2-acetamido-3-amino-2,3-dideoxy-glucuronate N-acetyltransferase
MAGDFQKQYIISEEVIMDLFSMQHSKIGKRTKIWHPELCNLYGDFIIGEDCNIGCFVEIGPGVIIGDRCRIGAHCFIPEGVTIEEDCFIGPHVTFTNDRYPPGGREAWRPILVRKKVSIGAGSVILPGVEIGEGAMVGAGTVVVRNIPAGIRVVGNPARRIIPAIIKCERGEMK